ncbi:hypothetical protein GCM10010256_73320 [Streptomyces coeruleorubidus]|nr:hypothetical protein GCM10010256_73320 [Streptomyces coeruleorubidus]
MTDGWGTVTASVVTIIGTIVVGVLAYRAGRAQVSDQARVEHGQWLRGQRQDAYVTFLTAWDQVVKSLKDEVKAIGESQQATSTTERERLMEAAGERVLYAPAPVRGPAEQVLLLGPDNVADAAGRMVDHLDGMQTAALNRILGASEPTSTAFHGAQQVALRHRREFLTLVRAVLRTPPAPH